MKTAQPETPCDRALQALADQTDDKLFSEPVSVVDALDPEQQEAAGSRAAAAFACCRSGISTG